MSQSSMSSTKVYRLSAVALTIGGVISALGAVGQSLDDQPLGSLWIPASLAVAFGLALVLLGLPAIYARQLKEVGKPGLIGFIVFFGAMGQFGGGGGVTDLILLPLAAKSNALANPSTAFILYFLIVKVLLLVGSVVLGIATLRAGAFPKGPAMLLIIGSVCFLLIGFRLLLIAYVGEVVFLLSFVWFGVALLSYSQRSIEQMPLPASARLQTHA